MLLLNTLFRENQFIGLKEGFEGWFGGGNCTRRDLVKEGDIFNQILVRNTVYTANDSFETHLRRLVQAGRCGWHYGSCELFRLGLGLFRRTRFEYGLVIGYAVPSARRVQNYRILLRNCWGVMRRRLSVRERCRRKDE